MYIVVVGGGMVGFHLTRALFNAGHEVFIVDTDGKRVEELIKHFGNVAIKGDGSEPSIQIAAGVARADIYNRRGRGQLGGMPVGKAPIQRPKDGDPD
jgi:trk system potassium uptake protein TrkA